MRMVNGLGVYEYGDPGNVPVLFIHGAAGGAWCWRDVVSRLPDFYCIAPDLPEHGASRDNKPFTIRSTSQQLLGLVKTLIPGRKFNLVGLSVGAQMAVEMVAKAPELISSTIASGAQALELPGFKLGIYSEFAMSLIYYLGIAPWKNSDGWIRWNMRSSAGISETFFPEFRRNFRELTRDSWSRPMAANYRFRIPRGIQFADLPVLLVGGDKETADVLPTNRELLKIIPGARAAIIADHRDWTTPQQHNWPMNDPALFAGMVRDWISNQRITDGLAEITREEIQVRLA